MECLFHFDRPNDTGDVKKYRLGDILIHHYSVFTVELTTRLNRYPILDIPGSAVQIDKTHVQNVCNLGYNHIVVEEVFEDGLLPVAE